MILFCCGDREGDPTFGAGGELTSPLETAPGTATGGDVTGDDVIVTGGDITGGDVTAELRLSFCASFSSLCESSATVGVALLKVGGVKFGNSSWMKFGKKVSIFFHVIPQSFCFGDSTSDWLLGVIKLSKMP